MNTSRLDPCAYAHVDTVERLAHSVRGSRFLFFNADQRIPKTSLVAAYHLRGERLPRMERDGAGAAAIELLEP